MRCRLSVVVPVYNVEKYLERCIKSLLSQTHYIDEIIIVDDGSPDKCGEIADALAAGNDNIIVIHQQNMGLSGARNTGIDNATGEYIGFVDSDDYVDPEMYSTLMRRAEENNAEISMCGVWYEQENGEGYSPFPLGREFVWDKKTALIELNSYRYLNMSVWKAVYKRELFEIEAYGEKQLRFPVGKNSEDYYLMHRIIARAERIAYTSEPFYHYIQRNNSISRYSTGKISTEAVSASLSQLDFFNKWFPQLSYVAETASAFSHMGIYSGYVRRGMNCPKDLLEKLQEKSRSFLRSVLKNPYIPKVKKAQAFAFCYVLPVYKAVIARTSHR